MARPSSKDPLKAHREGVARMWREIKVAPLADLVGIVRPEGVFAMKAAGMDFCSLAMELMAWRIGASPVKHGLLEVRKKMARGEVERTAEVLTGYQVVSMRARVAEVDGKDAPQALMVGTYKQTREDKELLEIASKLAAPVRIKDPRFKTLTLNAGRDAFEGHGAWGKSRVPVTLNVDRQRKATGSLDAARKLFGGWAKWDRAARKCIGTSHHSVWLKAWRLPEDPALTLQRFIAKPKLERVVVKNSGSFELWYDDRDLFGGHGLLVEGRVDRGVTKVRLEG